MEETPGTVEAVTGEAAQPIEEGRDEDEQHEAQERKQLAWEIDGYLRTELRFRNVSDENDLDLYVHLFADVTHTGKVPLRARVNGRLKWDMVGNQNRDDLLRDYWDGFDSELTGRLYETYVDLYDLAGDVFDVRLGRQFVDDSVWVHFDGVRLDTDLSRKVENLDFSFLFGVPVQYAESGRSGNWMAGALFRYRLGSKTRILLDYYHVSEWFEGINDPVVDPPNQPVSVPAERLEDDYLGLSVWHTFGRSTHLHGRFTLLDWEANELLLRGRWNSADGAWTVILDYYQMFKRLRNVVNDLTPYVPMMGVYHPFWRLGARINYRLGERWLLQGGYTYRGLTNEEDEGTFNHEYHNYFVGVTVFRLLDERVDVSVVANGYSSSSNDVTAVTGTIDFRLSSEVTLAGGVDYALFKYDYLLDSEHEDVWTYWLDARWRQSKSVEVRGRVAVDDDRFHTYTTLELVVIVRF